MTGPFNFYRAAGRAFKDHSSNTVLVKPKTLIIWGALDTALTVI